MIKAELADLGPHNEMGEPDGRGAYRALRLTERGDTPEPQSFVFLVQVRHRNAPDPDRLRHHLLQRGDLSARCAAPEPGREDVANKRKREPMKKLHVIRIIDDGQSRRPSIIRRVVPIASFCAFLFGPALLFDSAAMQWAGFVITFVCGVAMIFASADGVTVAEAREKLDRVEREARGE